LESARARPIRGDDSVGVMRSCFHAKPRSTLNDDRRFRRNRKAKESTITERSCFVPEIFFS